MEPPWNDERCIGAKTSGLCADPSRRGATQDMESLQDPATPKFQGLWYK